MKAKNVAKTIIVLVFLLFPQSAFSQQEPVKTGVRAYNVNINWWRNFSDPYLQEYIYRALEKNHDLKRQNYITEQYRQTIKTVMSDELPSLTLSPAFARIKTARQQIFDVETATLRTNNYAIPLAAYYEADIFLKNHDKTAAAKKEYDSYKYKEKAADITLAADVAAVYINILKLDKTIKTQQKITNIRQKIKDLTQERYKMGLASLYDVTYTDKLHTQAQIELNDLKKDRSLLLHRMEVLTDTAFAQSGQFLCGDFDKIEYTAKIPDYISSEVVIQRPDLMKAEAELQKAKIDVKVARKEFLPSIQIFGVAGYNSLLLKNLFNWENIFALIAAAAMQKIFTGGYLTANLQKKTLVYLELFEAYKQADLIAIQEINDALCKIKHDTQKDSDNLKKLQLEASNFNLIQERYKAGIESYLNLIQYEENLLSLQKEKDGSKAQRLVDCISLYKAAGAKL